MGTNSNCNKLNYLQVPHVGIYMYMFGGPVWVHFPIWSLVVSS